MNNTDITAVATSQILAFITDWKFASPNFLAWALDMNHDFVMDICRTLVSDGVLVSHDVVCADNTGWTLGATGIDGADLNLKLA